MTFSGEFGFIEMLRRDFEGVGDKNIFGIGDDCAVMPLAGGESLVITTDMLNEEVHFLREATSAYELGAKSLVVNLSDIAAMGATPLASFLSLALPKTCRDTWAEEFVQGYRDVSVRYNVRLAGGDTTASKNGVVINVGLIGKAKNSHLKYRSGAKAGDIIAVNGMLGESAAGLDDILKAHHETERARLHRNPIPQVEEGIWLGGRREVHSMIDLSDGMASDLKHILRASGVGAEIDIASIPTLVPLKYAVAGGEDYKLLFTVSPESWEKLWNDYIKRFGTELYAVGGIKAGEPAITWMEDGLPAEKDWQGYTHF